MENKGTKNRTTIRFEPSIHGDLKRQALESQLAGEKGGTVDELVNLACALWLAIGAPLESETVDRVTDYVRFLQAATDEELARVQSAIMAALENTAAEQAETGRARKAV